VLLLAGALVAGVLTAASPCVLPVLPVVLGSAAGGAPSRVAVLVGSLAASVVAFTLLLRAGTLLVGVPKGVWPLVSGALLLGLGLTQLVPAAWERAAAVTGLGRSHVLLRSGTRPGAASAVLTGAALGPVFSSCSPLYGYVVATVLPASAALGLALLLAYVAGLAGAVLAVAGAGRRAVAVLRPAADPRGGVRLTAGVLLVLVGVAVLVGADRSVETWAVEHLPLTGLWTFDAHFLPAR
jgi:cytochrome c-type biogenesis protein